jgi:hypothetical protein
MHMAIDEAKRKLHDEALLLERFRRRSAIRKLSASPNQGSATILAEALCKGHPDAARIETVLRQLSVELEAVVNAAQFPAFIDGGREIKAADLLAAASTMVPFAKSHREHIEELRKLVIFGQARNASRASKVEEVNIENLRDKRVPDELGMRKAEGKMDL